jgi:oxaloacetate decarboxylase alpha subunit
MLTNLESQLREQNAADRFDDVLAEIPSVREDLGFIPLVTPTSQIVGTQAVMNVLMGQRYKSISKEAAGVLRGEYGDTPAPVNAELRVRVLEGAEPVTGRPADQLEPEMDRLHTELEGIAGEKNIRLADAVIDDVLTYALFPQVGLRFLEHRDDPSAFEPVPEAESAQPAAPVAASQPAATDEPALYTVRVNGRAYTVEVAEGGDLESVQPAGGAPSEAPPAQGGQAAEGGEPVTAGLAGTIFKVLVAPGQQVAEGDVLMVLEAMKMETEISAPRGGTVGEVAVKEGDSVAVGETLLTLS